MRLQAYYSTNTENFKFQREKITKKGNLDKGKGKDARCFSLFDPQLGAQEFRVLREPS